LTMKSKLVNYGLSAQLQGWSCSCMLNRSELPFNNFSELATQTQARAQPYILWARVRGEKSSRKSLHRHCPAGGRCPQSMASSRFWSHSLGSRMWTFSTKGSAGTRISSSLLQLQAVPYQVHNIHRDYQSARVATNDERRYIRSR